MVAEKNKEEPFDWANLGTTAGGSSCANCPKLLSRIQSMRQSSLVGMILREVLLVEREIKRALSHDRRGRNREVDPTVLWDQFRDLEPRLSRNAKDLAYKIKRVRNELNDLEFFESITATESARIRENCQELIRELCEY